MKTQVTIAGVTLKNPLGLQANSFALQSVLTRQNA